jgi:hypothetical protein
MEMGKIRRRPSTLRFVGTLIVLLLLLHGGVTAAQQPDTTTDSKGLRIRSNTSSLGLRNAADLVPRNDAIEALEQGGVTTELFEVVDSDGRQVGFLLGRRLSSLLLMFQSHEKH